MDLVRLGGQTYVYGVKCCTKNSKKAIFFQSSHVFLFLGTLFFGLFLTFFFFFSRYFLFYFFLFFFLFLCYRL